MWIMTTGLQFAIGWWYRKAAVFYLPPGWFGPLTWWLALPFAPAGSVSCGVWQMACKRVIKVGERVVKEVMAPSHAQGECSSFPTPTPAPVPCSVARSLPSVRSSAAARRDGPRSLGGSYGSSERDRIWQAEADVHPPHPVRVPYDRNPGAGPVGRGKFERRGGGEEGRVTVRVLFWCGRPLYVHVIELSQLDTHGQGRASECWKAWTRSGRVRTTALGSPCGPLSRDSRGTELRRQPCASRRASPGRGRAGTTSPERRRDSLTSADAWARGRERRRAWLVRGGGGAPDSGGVPGGTFRGRRPARAST